MLIRDLGILAAAAYEETVPKGYGEVDRRRAGGAMDGFQAVAYSSGTTTVVSFRGTEQKVDVGIDIMLGLGANTPYFSMGEEFVHSVRTKRPHDDIILTGHSLGGAIAQVAANRLRLPMVTFNAPGVAVFASRHLLTANPRLLAVRTAGMVASAVVAPGQAMRDLASTFHTVKGLNVCLMFDVVSQYGLHYGKVVRIQGTGINPLTEHSIATVNKVLETHEVGGRPAVFA